MDTYLKILKLLYSYRNEDDLLDLAKRCEGTELKEYSEEDWKEVLREDVNYLEVQLRLVKTLYQLNLGYTGVAKSILTSFEDWGEGKFKYQGFKIEIKTFIYNYYTLLAFGSFKNLFINTQIVLLGSRFLSRAFLLKVPVVEKIKDHFRSFCDVFTLKNHCLLLTKALEQNIYPIGKDLIKGHGISEWIEIYKKSKLSVKDFLVNNEDIKKDNDEDSKKMIENILTLYDLFLTGKIWKDIEKTTCSHDHKDENKNSKKIDEVKAYFNELNKEDSIKTWLEDKENVMSWLLMQDDKENLVKTILNILQSKINLDNEEEIALVISFVEDLQKNKILKKDQEIIYFDEEQVKFIWNKDLS